MRSVVRVRFAGNHVPGGPQAVLGPAGCGPDVATIEDVPVLRQVEVWVTLDETDPRVAALFRLLKAHGVTWLDNHIDIYTEEELNQARLLLLVSKGECELSGGARWGTTFDFSDACKACGTGARQTSAMFVNGDEIRNLQGHRAGATYVRHYLVEGGLAQALVESGATGASFHSVYAVMPDERQVRLPWKQLTAEKTLPRMSQRTTGLERERACPVCQRNGFVRMQEEPTRIVYRASDLRDADDINFSWENYWFSVLDPDPRECLLSSPWLLVTPKVRRIFMNAGVTSFDWLPIRVEGEE